MLGGQVLRVVWPYGRCRVPSYWVDPLEFISHHLLSATLGRGIDVVSEGGQLQ